LVNSVASSFPDIGGYRREKAEVRAVWVKARQPSGSGHRAMVGTSGVGNKITI